MNQTIAKLVAVSLVTWTALFVAGCAKHADFVELRDHLATMSKSQDQDQKRLDALQRRMESMERVRDGEPTKLKLDELSSRLQKIEARMAKLEEGAVAITQPKAELVPVDPTRSSKLPKPVALRGRSIFCSCRLATGSSTAVENTIHFR